ncbi:hypothetical protein P3T76_011809 [Phytophthora citrophthora]|uniref:Uncharacterized protein n=1 Tax=Phytophthora citrophthora TaxID=4793 RepID=A0AAD9G877_9STRA|nr:hypothetical protein P3T76_011809 [Phytophthora citrophthora]
MPSIQTLLKVSAFCTFNASLLSRTHAQVSEDPSCRATLEMIHNGLMAVTDPTCLVANGEPGCDLFGLPDCRVCALTSESLDDDIPLCESLDIFNHDDTPGEESLADEGFNDEPLVPPPVVPVTPVDPIEPVEPVEPVEPANPTEPSVEEEYVPTVIVLPSDELIEPESSIWDDSEGSSDFTDDSASRDEQDSARRLRTQL